MHIDGYKLVGEGIVQHATPNQGGLFAPGAPDTLVIHFTAGASIAFCPHSPAHEPSADVVNSIPKLPSASPTAAGSSGIVLHE